MCQIIPFYSLNSSLGNKPDGYTTVWNNIAALTSASGTYLKKTDINTKEFLKFRGDTDNANWATLPGVWITLTNTVDAADYGVLLVIGTSTNGFTGVDWYFQVWFKTDGNIHVRRSINATGGGGWTAWETISKS